MEWKSEKEFNPFNSAKLFAHVDYWKAILNKVPPPILVTVDPVNLCNLSCVWCNGKTAIDRSGPKYIGGKVLNDLANFLKEWGVRAVCIAGGGEPLMNSHVGKFIRELNRIGLGVGVVTNGTMIERYIEELALCDWVSVSVDCGNGLTYEKLKGSNQFVKVMTGIEKLVKYAKEKDTLLSFPAQGYGVTYKYLLHPENVGEIHRAAIWAKEVGCKNLHIRPAGTPYADLCISGKGITFTPTEIDTYLQELESAFKLDSEGFGIFAINHKFGRGFKIHNSFKSCWAIFMTAVFSPPKIAGEDFSMELCCDRRGDQLLLSPARTFKEVLSYWGSEEHVRLQKKININSCPRCTYRPHNLIFEQVILKNNMTMDFI